MKEIQKICPASDLSQESGVATLNNQSLGSGTSGTPNVIGNQAKGTHGCQFCERVFTTKTGLGVHKNRAHPVESNIENAPPQVKRRWHDEEMDVLARTEARWLASGGSGTINAALLLDPNVVALGRSLEAIKGVRRKESYKALVRQCLADLEGLTESPLVSSVAPTDEVLSTEPSLAVVVETGENSFVGSNDNDEVVELLLRNAGKRMSESRSLARRKERRRKGKKAKSAKETNRTRRRREYAAVQELYKKCRSRAAREIIDGHHGGVKHCLQELESYWRPVLEAVSTAPGPTKEALNVLAHEELYRGTDYSQLWAPVTEIEVKASCVDLHSAPGPDGIRPQDWAEVPTGIKAEIFTQWMVTGVIPERLRQCRTIFVPKSDSPSGPGEYRPISIASVPLRHLHSILAKRLLACCPPDIRQRGFICADGTMENSVVLDAVLGDCRRKLRECHMAVLDFSKAFDTVSHAALIDLLRERGLPGQFCDYVARLYSTSSTTLDVGTEKSSPVVVGRGVRQGDPLSPLLFNMALDLVLANLPKGVGYRLETELVSALAYADDLVLMAGSKVGLQSCIDAVDKFGQMMGLKLNHTKCSVLSMVPDGKRKKVHYLSDRTFKIGKRWLKQVSCVERWRYLGVDFVSSGSVTVEHNIKEALNNITKAPLKPQQRLELVRVHLIPRFLHGLVLGSISEDRLRVIDVQIRAAVRKWLRLPADVPTAYFHAASKDGGLAIPSLRARVPDLILRRFGALGTSEWPAARAAARSGRIQRKLRWAEKHFAKFSRLDSKTGVRLERLYWCERLHDSVDGFELRESSKCSASTKWIRDPDVQYTGRDYIQFVHTHINALPSRIRNSRGRRTIESELNCRAGCAVRETTTHTIQQCGRTHGGRILRHNKIAEILAAAMVEEGWKVEEEPKVQTSVGLRKPDIIAVRSGEGVVVDVQVVSGQRPLDDAHREKRAKYGAHDELIAKVAARLDLPKTRVRTTSCTISWRGVWSFGSYRELKRLLGLKESVFQSLSVLALRGSHMNWSRFNAMTLRSIHNSHEAGVGTQRFL